MRFESKDHRLTANSFRFVNDPLQERLVPQMQAVEAAHGQYRVRNRLLLLGDMTENVHGFSGKETRAHTSRRFYKASALSHIRSRAHPGATIPARGAL